MSGLPRNQERFARGAIASFEVYFREYAGGVLTDPSPAPIYKVYDPQGTLVYTATGTRTATGTYTAIYSVDTNAQLSNLWKIEWTAYVNNSLVADAWEYFTVVEAGSASFGDGEIVVDQTTMDRIKSVIGYPRITSISFITDTEIKKYCIEGCLRAYFNKFPIRQVTQQPIDASLEISFPDEFVYGVVNAQIVGKGGTGGSSDSFWDVVRWQIYTGYSMTGQYGVPRFNPNGQNDTFFMRNKQLNTIQNQLTTQDIRVDYDTRKLKVSSGIAGYVLVNWAKFSLNFADVRRTWYEDVIKLCSSRLLDLTGKTVGLLEDSDLTVKFNPEALKSEAKEMWDEVMTRWAEIPDVVMYRAT